MSAPASCFARTPHDGVEGMDSDWSMLAQRRTRQGQRLAVLVTASCWKSTSAAGADERAALLRTPPGAWCVLAWPAFGSILSCSVGPLSTPCVSTRVVRPHATAARKATSRSISRSTTSARRQQSNACRTSNLVQLITIVGSQCTPPFT